MAHRPSSPDATHTRAGDILKQSAVQGASMYCARTFGWARHTTYAHDATHTHDSSCSFILRTCACTSDVICPVARCRGSPHLVPGSSPNLGGGPSSPREPRRSHHFKHLSEHPLQVPGCLGCVMLCSLRYCTHCFLIDARMCVA